SNQTGCRDRKSEQKLNSVECKGRSKERSLDSLLSPPIDITKTTGWLNICIMKPETLERGIHFLMIWELELDGRGIGRSPQLTGQWGEQNAVSGITL
ncbi:hypothetical protein STEG23_027353, partial [Scotinomys teguina]